MGMNYQDFLREQATEALADAKRDFEVYSEFFENAVQWRDDAARRLLTAAAMAVELGIDDAFARKLVEGELANRRIPE